VTGFEPPILLFLCDSASPLTLTEFLVQNGYLDGFHVRITYVLIASSKVKKHPLFYLYSYTLIGSHFYQLFL
jgi:hypothetical protein